MSPDLIVGMGGIQLESSEPARRVPSAAASLQGMVSAYSPKLGLRVWRHTMEEAVAEVERLEARCPTSVDTFNRSIKG